MQIGRAAAVGLAAWLLVAITGESGRSEPGPAPIVVAQASAAEIEFWRSVESSKDPAEFEAYLKAYPTGQFAPLANIRLKKLRSAEQSEPAASASQPAEPPQGVAAQGVSASDPSIPPVPPHKVEGMIGIPIRDISPERARELGLAVASGVEVESILPDSPAARASLKPGDVVLSFNGEPVADVAHLVRLSRSGTPGSFVELQVLRGGARQLVKVALTDAFESIWTRAHRGDRTAMLSLGVAYARGELVDRDHGRANIWIRRAADAGSIVAMHVLGVRQQNGFGFERSESEAVRWYGKVANAIRTTRDPAELEAYLRAYPKGQFAPHADIRLKKFRSEGQPEASAGTSKPAEPPSGLAARSGTIADANIPPAPPHKMRGAIGVQIRNVDEKLARELGLAAASGAIVVSVATDGPAAESGVAPRDVVLSVNGEPITDGPHFMRLTTGSEPGRNAELSILRNGERKTLNVAVADYFEQMWKWAHRGDPVIMHLVGSFFSRGQLVDQDHGQANVWFRRAADAGNVQSMWTLGWRYAGGHGVQQDDREAVRWYRKSADAGLTDGMFSLGFHYHHGRGVERDLAEAARWHKMAGDKGHSGGLHAYGLALMTGSGVAKNDTLAVDYFRQPAKLNNAASFSALGLAYYYGRGVAKDTRQAAEWFRRAADRNMNIGFWGLAKLYETGEGGLPKDRNEAIRNYRKAAEGGDANALEQLKKLKASPHDPDEVQKLLANLGFDPGPRPGSKTADAIRKFQQSRALPVDGMASLRLVGQLREAMKQKTAAATTAAPSANAFSTGGVDLDALMDLEKLD